MYENIIVIILILLFVVFYKDDKKTWYQCKINDKGSQLFRNALTNNNIKRTNDDNWDIILPCNQNYTYGSLKKIKIKNNKQIIPYMSNSGIIGNKDLLWKSLLKYYGRTGAETIMPETYILPNDLKIFMKRYKKKTYFVLKNEKQRQEGILITNDITKIKNHKNDGYLVVQKYLGTPLTFRGYKFNLRFYLIHIVNPHNTSSYIFNDLIFKK